MSRRRMLGQIGGRVEMWLGIVFLSGLIATALVHTAPGFGMDERLLDQRLGDGARHAIVADRAGSGSAIRDYLHDLARLARGDLGTSVSLNRPVSELLAERSAVSLRSGAA